MPVGGCRSRKQRDNLLNLYSSAKKFAYLSDGTYLKPEKIALRQNTLAWVIDRVQNTNFPIPGNEKVERLSNSLHNIFISSCIHCSQVQLAIDIYIRPFIHREDLAPLPTNTPETYTSPPLN